MKILLDSLDPHLRPVTPDYEDPKSVALLEEHWQLADEYWKVIKTFLSYKLWKRKFFHHKMNIPDEQNIQSIVQIYHSIFKKQQANLFIVKNDDIIMRFMSWQL